MIAVETNSKRRLYFKRDHWANCLIYNNIRKTTIFVYLRYMFKIRTFTDKMQAAEYT